MRLDELEKLIAEEGDRLVDLLLHAAAVRKRFAERQKVIGTNDSIFLYEDMAGYPSSYSTLLTQRITNALAALLGENK